MLRYWWVILIVAWVARFVYETNALSPWTPRGEARLAYVKGAAKRSYRFFIWILGGWRMKC